MSNVGTPRAAALFFALALAGAFSMLYYHLGLFIPRAQQARVAAGLNGGYAFGNDFYQVWLTSQEALRHRSNPYSAEMTRRVQTGLYGRTLDPHISSDPVDQRVFPYPAFTDLLFWPAALVRFSIARVVATCLLAALTLASIALWMRALSWQVGWRWQALIFLLLLCSYPVLEGLYAGQIGLLVGFLLAASIFALQRDRLLLSGFLMALTTIKPQVTVLAILYLLAWSSYDRRRRGRFYTGFVPTMLLLVGAALVVWPHWIQSWMLVITKYRGYTTPPLIDLLLASLLGPGAAGLASFIMTASLLVAAILLAWRNRAAAAGSREFWLTLALLLALTTVALLPGQAVYDHIILFPGIIFLLLHWKDMTSSSRVLRIVSIIGAAVFFWPWIAAIGLVIARHWLSPKRFFSPAVFALPIRTAVSFPFLVLILLALATRLSSLSPEAS